MRLTLSILMLISSIAGFVVFIVPHYDNISALKAQAANYNTVLANARTLQEEQNSLVTKYNSFTPNQLSQLNTMLPSSPQNVPLILELDAVASQYGMVLQNVKIEDPTATPTTPAVPGAPAPNTDIGTLTIDFSVAGPYNSFTSFIKTIETSLRIIDIQKVSFTALTPNTQNYQYSVSINTYWLK